MNLERRLRDLFAFWLNCLLSYRILGFGNRSANPKLVIRVAVGNDSGDVVVSSTYDSLGKAITLGCMTVGEGVRK